MKNVTAKPLEHLQVFSFCPCETWREIREAENDETDNKTQKQRASVFSASSAAFFI